MGFEHNIWHTFYFDSKTGKADYGAACQGYRDGSACGMLEMARYLEPEDAAAIRKLTVEIGGCRNGGIS